MSLRELAKRTAVVAAVFLGVGTVYGVLFAAAVALMLILLGAEPIPGAKP